MSRPPNPTNYGDFIVQMEPLSAREEAARIALKLAANLGLDNSVSACSTHFPTVSSLHCKTVVNYEPLVSLDN